MKLQQPVFATILKPNDIMQVAFKHVIDSSCKEYYELYPGAVIKVSNRRNLKNDKGKYYAKSAVEIQQHRDGDKKKGNQFFYDSD